MTGRQPGPPWTSAGTAAALALSTYGFAGLKEGAKEVRCSELADAIIAAMA